MRVVHVLRKPLSEGTVASNTLRHGCGGLHIDASRVGTDAGWSYPNGAGGNGFHGGVGRPADGSRVEPVRSTGGRWPANLILQHLDGCRCEGIKKVAGRIGSSGWSSRRGLPSGGFKDGKYSGNIGHGNYTGSAYPGFSDEDGKETVANWICAEGCPVLVLDAQGGSTTSKQSMRGVGWSDSEVFGAGDPGFDTKRGYDDEGGVSRFFKQIGGNHEPTP